MSKLTIETFDYSREYSLNTLADVFRCQWDDIPENSNGVINANQQVQVSKAGQDTYEVEEFINLTWRQGYVFFGDTNKNMSVSTFLFTIMNEPILNIEGI